MYRITGTRFYSEHGRIVGNDGEAACTAIVGVAVSKVGEKKKKNN